MICAYCTAWVVVTPGIRNLLTKKVLHSTRLRHPSLPERHIQQIICCSLTKRHHQQPQKIGTSYNASSKSSSKRIHFHWAITMYPSNSGFHCAVKHLRSFFGAGSIKSSQQWCLNRFNNFDTSTCLSMIRRSRTNL